MISRAKQYLININEAAGAEPFNFHVFFKNSYKITTQAANVASAKSKSCYRLAKWLKDNNYEKGTIKSIIADINEYQHSTWVINPANFDSLKGTVIPQ